MECGWFHTELDPQVEVGGYWWYCYLSMSVNRVGIRLRFKSSSMERIRIALYHLHRLWSSFHSLSMAERSSLQIRAGARCENDEGR